MNSKHLIDWAIRNMSKRGLIRTSKIAGNVILDLTFDIWYGTETMRWVGTDELGANSEHDANAVSYRASKAMPLRKLLRKLDLSGKDYTFVDLGSGKGRVLLLASQLGFDRIIGVEFSPGLCAIARQNIAKFTRQIKTASKIEVVCADVANYNVPLEDCIFYLFNPFDAVVLQQFLINLRDTLEFFPRRIWLIYNTPLHANIVRGSEIFKSVEDFEIGGAEFKVYRNF